MSILKQLRLQRALFSTTGSINNVSTITESAIQTPVTTTTNTTTTIAQEKRLFTDEEASKSAPLIALHQRLNLPSEFKYSLLARSLTCRSTQNKYVDNYSLNILGKNFLSYYVTEYLLAKYPRLPLPILNTAVASYISTESLYTIGKHSWGIEVDETSALTKFLNKEPAEYSFGKLRFLPIDQTEENGVTKLSSISKDETSSITAYALAVRSIIGGIFTSTKSEETTKKFIYDHILSRKLDVSKMFEFEQPTRELSKLCQREGLEKPVARLLAENGRNSNSAIYVIGVFSGEHKLGESYGASLKEAKIRASVNALKNWYLYKPVDATVPSDKNYKPTIVDHGIVVV